VYVEAGGREAAEEASGDRWPPTLRLLEPCDQLPDCVTADSVVAHHDTVAGQLVQVETALMSGGALGLERHPHLVAWWETADRRRVHVTGLANAPGTLDTLRAALGTLQLVER
jgi:hypothetical protein